MRTEEYRVIWYRQKREWDNERHKHFFVDGTDYRHVKRFGTLAAAEKFRLVLLGRGHEAHGVDPDAYWCCHGEDGCGGLTNREHYEKELERKDIAPLVGEPIIEARPVGDWSALDVEASA